MATWFSRSEIIRTSGIAHSTDTQKSDDPSTFHTSYDVDASDCKAVSSPLAPGSALMPSSDPKDATSCMTRIEGLCQAESADVEDSQLNPETLKKQKRLAKNRATASISRQVA